MIAIDSRPLPRSALHLMPRRSRFSSAGYVFHVLNRAVARQTLFHTEGDYDAFVRILDEARRSAEVTHDHEEGVRGAQATAAAVFLARTGATPATNAWDVTYPLPFTLSTRAASPDYESMNSNLVLRGDFHV